MRVEAEPTGRGAAVPAPGRSSKGGGRLEFEHAQRPKRRNGKEKKGETGLYHTHTKNKKGETGLYHSTTENKKGETGLYHSTLRTKKVRHSD